MVCLHNGRVEAPRAGCSQYERAQPPATDRGERETEEYREERKEEEEDKEGGKESNGLTTLGLRAEGRPQEEEEKTGKKSSTRIWMVKTTQSVLNAWKARNGQRQPSHARPDSLSSLFFSFLLFSFLLFSFLFFSFLYASLFFFFLCFSLFSSLFSSSSSLCFCCRTAWWHGTSCSRPGCDTSSCCSKRATLAPTFTKRSVPSPTWASTFTVAIKEENRRRRRK